MFKKVLKICAIAFSTIFMVLVIALWWYSPLPPLFDDGPFYGSTVNHNDKGEVIQSLPFRKSMTIQVLTNLRKDGSPIVQLKNEENQIEWEVLADGYDETTVSNIEFKTVNCFKLFLACNVTGVVTWTYGRERMNWHIWKWGSLRKYYYSW